MRSIQPQPASLVHPFSPDPGQFHFLDRGLEGVAACVPEAKSESREARLESLMGANWLR